MSTGTMRSMLYRVVVAVYGLVNILGGLFAFLSPSSKSVWSLVVGGTAGLLFLWFAAIAGKKPGFAFRAAAALAVTLAAFWVFRISEVVQLGKSPFMAVGNLILAIIVFGVLTGGHFLAMRKSNVTAEPK